MCLKVILNHVQTFDRNRLPFGCTFVKKLYAAQSNGTTWSHSRVLDMC